ncbi:MAG: TAXI family TRAP transporter solute-binding subunit [Oceanobacter sp.]
MKTIKLTRLFKTNPLLKIRHLFNHPKFILNSTLIALLAGNSTLHAEQTIKMATIAPGSSAYQVMTTMASMVNRASPDLTITVDATGTATKHQLDLAKGKIDLAMSAPQVHHFLRTGTKMYQKIENAPQLADNIGLLFWFPYGAAHVITYADSGIKTLADLKGKKVFLGPPGGGAWATSKAWVEGITGYQPGEDYENVRASWASALQGFQDRQFDVYISGGIPPFPQVEQLALTSKLRLIGLTKTEADAATDAMLAGVNRLGRYLDKIPSDAYENVLTGSNGNSDLYTAGASVGVVARMNLDADTVYRITKTFWENLPQEAKTAPYLTRIRLEEALSADNIKLHPGALKYYREIGLSIPEKML